MTKEAGRNDPCPCGSGKKYKKCCMVKEQKVRRFKAQVLQGGPGGPSGLQQMVLTAASLQQQAAKNVEEKKKIVKPSAPEKKTEAEETVGDLSPGIPDLDTPTEEKDEGSKG